MKGLALTLVMGVVGGREGFLGTATPPLSTAICQPGGCVLLGRQTLQTESGLSFVEYLVALRPLKLPLRFGMNEQGQIQWAEASLAGHSPSAAELPVLVRFVHAATGRWVSAAQIGRCFKAAQQKPAGARSATLVELNHAGVVCVTGGPHSPFKLAAFQGSPH
ncbi:hypothetical protein [Deinococcus multiflagellatus]|uniref:Uncharacterized protein n=1 Tax=Deinococcus multiflagellatus TaxID=1656887 RepID=A0ABW1ZHP8_9DEIO